jgi:hypothetical protein
MTDIFPLAATNPIELGAFRSWLAALPSTTRVGFARDPQACPLATYLKRLYPQADVCVSRMMTVSVHRLTMVLTKPSRWQECFMFKVDALCSDNNAIGVVTAGEALRLLVMVEMQLRDEDEDAVLVADLLKKMETLKQVSVQSYAVEEEYEAEAVLA